MYENAKNYAHSLFSVAAGSFNDLEYDGQKRLVLRVDGIREPDMSRLVSMEFTPERAEVVTNNTFGPSEMTRLQPGTVYQLCTTVHVKDELKAKMKVELIDDARTVMMLPSDRPIIYDDMITFLVLPFRQISIVPMFSPAVLLFEAERKKPGPRAKEAGTLSL